MKIGKVIGKVWSTKRHPSLPVGAYVTLQMSDGEMLVALDSLGVGPGDEALIVQGSVAEKVAKSTVDAVVVGIIDPVKD